MSDTFKLIYTVKESCRVCYTCVRDCPAKAIRISGGQAEVINERCIGCGNCVRVCSQNAKQVYASVWEAEALLDADQKVAAILAPSFPAEFLDFKPETVVGMVRALGFEYVNEVAFGADLVARQYRKLIRENPDKQYIATTCPALVTYVEKYHPALVKYLAPIVSPMVAAAKVLRQKVGPDVKIVFIGPCFAKKSEARRDQTQGLIDSVLTFAELRMLFKKRNLLPETVEQTDFDPPYPEMGMVFPVTRGLVQTSGLNDDIVDGEVIATDGKMNFVHAIKEFEKGDIRTRLLEVLCCTGCIMGPGFSRDQPYFSRRTAVSEYAKVRLDLNRKRMNADERQAYFDTDLSVNFEADDLRVPLPTKEEINEVLRRMGKEKPEDELDCGACGYETCREHAVAILKGLAESEMCLPYTIERLKKSLQELNLSHEQLASTRQALINAEKMASMGQLSAGIAHEINNPLGVILLYSKMLLEDCDPQSEEYEDLKMIAEQAERCKTIVSGLLNFARKNKVTLKPTNVRELIDRCLKAVIKPQNIEIRIEHRLTDQIVDLDEDQIIQVLTNLIVNAIEAMPEGGVIRLITEDKGSEWQIIVEDTGCGIPEHILPKIFEPLFTTKKVGKGTGLGLAVTYGIIKMHHGKIDVKSNADPDKGATGTRFTITLPKRGTWQTLLNNKN
ncbi:MAG: 4Fe-4S dicluster domain-containing protein [Calditrichaeota bacterium]|nr:4Fe-4S dicluster domain-containing protein [Calditrichota bacterium]